MEVGKEAWKWGLVLILLAVLLLVGHQAYVAVTSQEDYPPPEDYKMGDSFDIERTPGPGAGQPVSLPNVVASEGIAAAPAVEPASAGEAMPPMPTELPSSIPDSFQNLGPDTPTPDWNQIKDPSQK
ncbi:MAG TPA: hypothetical protein PLP29_16850 [Candidatus Ozemobacteraceae bacterium]|nr:hypothetical protein [Candidatus Ozemobacteraceae bacterium]